MPSTADVIQLAAPLIALATGAYTRLGNQVRALAFGEYCECAPAGGIGCTTRTMPLAFIATSGSACGANSWYPDAGGSTASLFPAGQHHVTLEALDLVTTHDLQVDIYSPGKGEHCFTWLANTAFRVEFDGTPTDPYWGLAFRDAGSRPIWIESATLTIMYRNLASEPDCSPGGTTIPPPPDLLPPPGWLPPPAPICSDMQQVCNEVGRIGRIVDQIVLEGRLLQRWGKPFGYVEGTEHPDLASAGSFPVTRLLGMSVFVVTPPPGEPVLPGNPPYLWDCGWMSINDANGMLEEKRITRSGFGWFPRDMPLATSFNYALTPGTTVTTRELLPEP